MPEAIFYDETGDADVALPCPEAADVAVVSLPRVEVKACGDCRYFVASESECYLESQCYESIQLFRSLHASACVFSASRVAD